MVSDTPAGNDFVQAFNRTTVECKCGCTIEEFKLPLDF